jgi:heme exporter protein C
MSSFWEFANPRRFMGISQWLSPWLFALAGLCLAVGLVWGFFFTPDDFRQGSTVKIIYLHVPSAMMAINAWVMMLVASLVWLIRRHHVSALAAKAAAPVGVTFTLIALFTGAIWGQPMWGTWWAWDPRLTSFLILFLFYLGYMALWAAIEDPDTAADLTSVLCLVGSVFAVLSRYARTSGTRACTRARRSRSTRRRTSRTCSGFRSSSASRASCFCSWRSSSTARRPRSGCAGCTPSGSGAHGMMPDLGRYAVEVLSAYAVSIGLLAGIVGISVARARRVRRALDEAEARHRRG